MRAVVHDRYGPPDVLRLDDVERPVPEDDEILVAVHATTVNRTDCGFRNPRPFFVRIFSGFLRPKNKILGTELAGEVVAAGAAVTKFKMGDHVSGVQADRFGAHAEFVCVREDGPLARKPNNMTFEEAAAVCDGVILARTCLRWAGVREGQRIVVYGASGSIGTAGVQLAKHLGAHVTAVCNTANVDRVRSLGADEVIDHTQEDFTENGETYDVIFDAVGKLEPSRGKKALKSDGIYLNVNKDSASGGGGRPEALVFLTELIEAGKVRAVIDRCYPLEEIVEAHTYVEKGHKKGHVVVTVA